MYSINIPSIDPSALSLAIATLLCTSTTYRCITPPNPIPTTTSRDRMRFSAHPCWLQFRLSLVVLIGIWHAYLCLTPSPSICLGSANVSQDLFTWNIYTVFCLICILVAGQLRLLAFKQLGSSFTFTVAKPKTLITTGLYHYVQHPSYAGLVVLMIANRCLFERLDGAAACFLPGWVVRWKYVWMSIMSAKTVGWAVLRVRDEEKMMKDEFGEEWIAYHGRTKRFIPWVF